MTISSQSDKPQAAPQAFMTAADGSTVPAPPDLPERLAAYRSVMSAGRAFAAALAGVDLAEVRRTRELIAPAVPDSMYAPGGELHADGVMLRALEAFAAVMAAGRGEAQSAAARVAAARRLPPRPPSAEVVDGPPAEASPEAPAEAVDGVGGP